MAGYGRDAGASATGVFWPPLGASIEGVFREICCCEIVIHSGPGAPDVKDFIS